MGLITPLYDSLWNEYLAWSALVALFTFGWLYHHSFFYRSKDGENPNVDNLEAVSYTHLTLPTICSV